MKKVQHRIIHYNYEMLRAYGSSLLGPGLKMQRRSNFLVPRSEMEFFQLEF